MCRKGGVSRLCTSFCRVGGKGAGWEKGREDRRVIAAIGLLFFTFCFSFFIVPPIMTNIRKLST